MVRGGAEKLREAPTESRSGGSCGTDFEFRVAGIDRELRGQKLSSKFDAALATR